MLDAVLILLGGLLVASLLSGRTLNPFGALRPVVISRAKYPWLYWCQVGALATVTAYVAFG